MLVARRNSRLSGPIGKRQERWDHTHLFLLSLGEVVKHSSEVVNWTVKPSLMMSFLDDLLSLFELIERVSMPVSFILARLSLLVKSVIFQTFARRKLELKVPLLLM